MMRVTAFMSLCLVLMFVWLPFMHALPNSAVIADVTIQLPPPHDNTISLGCTDPTCGTIKVSGLAADGTWVPNGNATVTLNVPNGMKGFLLYAAAPNGKHVGTFSVIQGRAQLFDTATPAGSTLQHVDNNAQSQLVALWSAPADDGESTSVTFTALILENINLGYIQTMIVQQSNQPPVNYVLPTGVLPVQDAATPIKAAAAAAVVNCFLTVPANPLTAAGLATPYILSTDNTGNTQCTMTNAVSQAFVQGAIIDPATGKISIYNPLVITTGNKAAVAPTAPTLPANAVVALWFGFNGNQLTLQNAANNNNQQSLKQGKCVNGVQKSPFGTFAYCNAPQFFVAVQKAFMKGLIATPMNLAAVVKKTGKQPAVLVPAPGTAADGAQCPTLRDFFIVDNNQSDGTDTTYLVVTNGGATAQNTAANKKALAGTTTAINMGSATAVGDNLLLTTLVNPALKCNPGFQAPDLADNNNMVNALPLSEIQAALFQKFPTARVPALDSEVVVNKQANIFKLDNYRLGVLQFPVRSVKMANTKCYCKNMVKIAPARLMKNQVALTAAPSFVANMNLFAYMVNRFNNAVGANGLNCAQFGIKSPFTVANQATATGPHVLEHNEELNVWRRVPGTDLIRMTVLDANGDPNSVTVDNGMMASFDSIDMASTLENMDHNNALGTEMDVFADPQIDALITDPGTGIDDTTTDTPFLQTAAGLAVVIVVPVVVVLAAAGAGAFFYLRKRKEQHANTVSTMSMTTIA